MRGILLFGGGIQESPGGGKSNRGNNDSVWMKPWETAEALPPGCQPSKHEEQLYICLRYQVT